MCEALKWLLSHNVSDLSREGCELQQRLCWLRGHSASPVAGCWDGMNTTDLRDLWSLWIRGDLSIFSMSFHGTPKHPKTCGFPAEYCSTVPQDWSDWTECSATCGGGSNSRCCKDLQNVLKACWQRQHATATGSEWLRIWVQYSQYAVLQVSKHHRSCLPAMFARGWNLMNFPLVNWCLWSKLFSFPISIYTIDHTYYMLFLQPATTPVSILGQLKRAWLCIKAAKIYRNDSPFLLPIRSSSMVPSSSGARWGCPPLSWPARADKGGSGVGSCVMLCLCVVDSIYNTGIYIYTK